MSKGKKKIMVIDDEPNLVEMVQVWLQTSGYDVITAYESLQGLEKVQKEKPDLVILDIMMPNVDGFSVCRRMKEHKATKNIPVIILTVKWLPQDKAEGLAAGAECYMTKPFEATELLDNIKKILKLH